MSRSYKKTPWCGDRKGKAKKRIANHKMRRALNGDPDLILPIGGHRKFTETWDICDYGWLCSWASWWDRALRDYEWQKMVFPDRPIEFPNKKREYKRWLKYYRSK